MHLDVACVAMHTRFEYYLVIVKIHADQFSSKIHTFDQAYVLRAYNHTCDCQCQSPPQLLKSK